MRLSDYRKWISHTKEDKENISKDVTCRNCQAHFDGNYCPVCGQGIKELDRPFGFIVINFVGDMFAFDTRFLRTIKDLTLKPGYLTEQFFEGKRIRYATPTRLFILSSFILFFLLQVYSNRILTTVLDAPVTSGNVQVNDSVSVVLPGLMFTEDKPAPDSVAIDFSGINLNLDAFVNKSNIREGLLEISNQMEAELSEETDPEERAKLMEQIRLIRTPEQAIVKILKYMSWAFFLLLPLFALILKLFYFRQHHFYIRHLIFSIHLHTFLFFIYIILISLLLLFEKVNPYIILAFLLTIPVYFITALKKFYGQNIFKVILKFAGISMLYNLLFWIVVGWVFLRALSII